MATVSEELTAKIRKNSEKIRRLQMENEELTDKFQVEKASEFIEKKLGKIPKSIRELARKKLLEEKSVKPEVVE